MRGNDREDGLLPLVTVNVGHVKIGSGLSSKSEAALDVIVHDHDRHPMEVCMLVAAALSRMMHDYIDFTDMSDAIALEFRGEFLAMVTDTIMMKPLPSEMN